MERADAGPAHVVVIGAGISGLTAAERLGAGGLRVTVLEASDRLGGMIGTDRVGECLLERGPDVIVAAKPAARLLCERLGIGDRLRGTATRGGYVSRRGRLRRLPQGLTGLMPSRLAPIATSGILSPLGLAQLALEPLRPRRRSDDDESIESFMTRRLGRETYERICEPLLAGIYSGAGTRLSMDATFPQLRAMEAAHGSLLAGLRARPISTSSPFLTLPNGLQELIDALAAAFRAMPHVDVRLHATVRSVRAAGRPAATTGGVPNGRPPGAIVELANGECLTADAVIVAAPASVAARLLAPADVALSAELSAIDHGSLATVTLAYPAAAVRRRLDGTGYVVPRTEGRPVLACTWVSSKHHGRAPADTALFRVFVGGARHTAVPALPDHTLLGIARAELRATLGVVAEPTLARTTRWLGAMPQYHLGHPERVARIDRRVSALPWLALAGNAYRGVGVPDCIASGERAAARVAEQLVTAPPRVTFGSARAAVRDAQELVATTAGG